MSSSGEGNVFNVTELSEVVEKITEIAAFDLESLEDRQGVSPIRKLLDALVELKVFSIASLWKIKQESETICARERTTGFFDPDPMDPQFACEFVLEYSNSFLKDVINDAEFCSGKPIVIDNIHDIKYSTDIFFGKFIPEVKIYISTVIFLPLKTSKRRGKYNVSYMLVVYPNSNSYPNKINNHLLRAITNLISSTLSGMLDKRLNEITREVTSIAAGGADFFAPNLEQILTRVAQNVFPKYFKYSRLMMAWAPGEPDQYQAVAFESSGVALSSSIIEQVAGFVATCRDSCADIKIILDTEVHSRTCDVFKRARSSIIARISSRNGDDPYGYVALVDKISPLAVRLNGDANVVDIFDWEDELMMSHTIALLSMLAEMTHADARRQAWAAKYTHEMANPAFVIVSELAAINIPSASADARARIARALAQAKLQLQMTRGVLINYQNLSSPPSTRYNPPLQGKLTQLYSVAIESRDFAGPTCERMNVNPKNISIDRLLPQLSVDVGVFRQVFLNLFTNAIKYKGSLSFDKFQIIMECEFMHLRDIPCDDLSSETRLYVQKYIDKMTSRHGEGWQEGHYITVSDWGIGVPLDYERKIFARQVRAPNVTRWNVTGNGLGLSIVETIVREHFGAIWVEARENPTTFAMFLPNVLRRVAYTNDPEWKGNN